MIILGIETSCDETACALAEEKNGSIHILSNIVSSQIEIHKKWGGVVPNLAAREHLKNILPVLEKTLQKARLKPKDIDLISATQGPGLIPALLVGVDAAKTLSYIWKKPLIGIHHIEGHIYANFIGNEIGEISNFIRRGGQISKQIQKTKNRKLKTKFPILCLVVSGGHTQLVLMKDHLQYRIIGQTLDDAVGEAFDKTARILGLGYPGGPAIAHAADQYRLNADERGKIPQKSASSQPESALRLPRPMINSKDFNFSFSGLKTAALYLVRKIPPSQVSNLKSQICAEFQQAAIDVLISKTLKAAQKYKPKTIMLAGGVSANAELRKQLGNAVKNNLPASFFMLPTSQYCIDNAAMIAAAGYFRWEKMSESQKKKSLSNWNILKADANFTL